MDQGTPRTEVAASPRAAPPADNGLADQVAAVEAARMQLGRDLDRLTVEARAQMGQTMEKITWRAAAAGAGIVAGLAVHKLLGLGWEKARGEQPPTPTMPGTSWGEALAWTMALATGMGAAKLVAIRGAAAGWQKATGMLPPGLQDQPPIR